MLRWVDVFCADVLTSVDQDLVHAQQYSVISVKRNTMVGWLRDHKMAFLNELPEGIWICCDDCTTILVRVPERLPESLLDVIKMKQEEIFLGLANEIDVRWRLLPMF
ncbi:hypothetical protein PIB30_035053 [Stylosanthes scabra]|uniref:Uncharacterized protein n=1 Tax=Stylosanthes scabra TaxID=79078 RepID=A0ABU6XB31_9FABA|nr:hypothetical protein [Stylosanthes scabra]